MKAGTLLMKSWYKHKQLNSFAFKTITNKIGVCEGNICFANAHKVADSMPVTEFYLSMRQACIEKDGHLRWKEGYREFLSFVIKESKYKDLFITKRTCDALKHGLQFDCSKPANQVWFVACLVRSGWEYPDKLSIFHELVKEGIDKDVALILCWCTFTKDNQLTLSGSWVQGSSNHKVVPRDVTLTQLILASKRELCRRSNPLTDVFVGCRNIHRTLNINSEDKDVEGLVSSSKDTYGMLYQWVTIPDLKNYIDKVLNAN